MPITVELQLPRDKPHRGDVFDVGVVIDTGVTVFGRTNNWGGMLGDCIDTPAGGTMIWNIVLDAQDCNGVYLY